MPRRRGHHFHFGVPDVRATNDPEPERRLTALLDALRVVPGVEDVHRSRDSFYAWGEPIATGPTPGVEHVVVELQTFQGEPLHDVAAAHVQAEVASHLRRQRDVTVLLGSTYGILTDADAPMPRWLDDRDEFPLSA